MENVKNPPENTPKQPKPASRTIPGIILRLILVVGVGCLIGSVIYFAASGWVPYLDERIFQPIDTNQALVKELQATQSALEDQITSLQSTLADNQSGAGPEIAATLDQIAENIGLMQSDIDTNTYYAITQAPALIATVSARQESNSRNLSALATAQMRDSGNSIDIELLRNLELLSWAHQYMLHNNYGLAEGELSIARENLSNLVTKVPPKQRVVIIEMLNLVDECLADLPARPTLAAEKLQLAWHLGVSEFPYGSLTEPSGTISPTISITPSITPTPTPN
jgi:hypothetical protein